jgi:DNA-damage-inducible protein D
MADFKELQLRSDYKAAMEHLEAVKRTTGKGTDYWMAREINLILGYPTWREFEGVIERAKSACGGTDLDPSDHFVPTHKMVEIGSGAKRQAADYFLSRAACYLIAMNGDPSKPEIAAAQAYFAIQTRRMEQHDQITADEKRLELRGKVSKSFRKVSGVAKDAGVRNSMQPVFHDARYLGLYEMQSAEVKRRRGLSDTDNLFDFAGPLELSANDFQMNLAVEVLSHDAIRGEQRAISVNREVAGRVRRVMKDSGATMPESLPLEPPIKEIKKRIKAARKKLLPKPGDPST